MGRGSSKVGGGGGGIDSIMALNSKLEQPGALSGMDGDGIDAEIDKLIKGMKPKTTEDQVALKTLQSIRKAKSANSIDRIITKLSSNDDISNALYSALTGIASSKIRVWQPI